MHAPDHNKCRPTACCQGIAEDSISQQPNRSDFPMSDYALQRLNMVETQVRTNDVTDPRIHAAMGMVARERFVPPEKRSVAYADVAPEIAPGRFLPDPRTFAKLLQLANI